MTSSADLIAAGTESAKPYWSGLELECHECGKVYRGRALQDMDLCSSCCEFVCNECTCKHSMSCWGLLPVDRKDCCSPNSCTCPCHEEVAP